MLLKRHYTEYSLEAFRTALESVTLQLRSKIDEAKRVVQSTFMVVSIPDDIKNLILQATESALDLSLLQMTDKERDRLRAEILKVEAVEIQHTGTSPEQNFSHRFINSGMSDGWLTIAQGQLTLHGIPEDLVYHIKRTPGHYCCHCGESLSGEIEARLHVGSEHSGEQSPDPQNPAGYLHTTAYECVLSDDQHQKYNAHALKEV